MGIIDVTLSEMDTAADRIEKASEDYLAVAKKVISSAESLSNSWEGDSQVAFIEEQRKAYEWYQQMMELVADYISKLRSARQQYESTDQESAALIKGC